MNTLTIPSYYNVEYSNKFSYNFEIRQKKIDLTYILQFIVLFQILNWSIVRKPYPLRPSNYHKTRFLQKKKKMLQVNIVDPILIYLRVLTS